MNIRQRLLSVGSGALAALVLAGWLVHAQEGGGPEGGSGLPVGSTFSTQYKASGTTFGGAGPGTLGFVLTSNGAASAPTYQAAGTGAPCGATTQIQFNSAGACGASSLLTWNGATLASGPADTMTVNGVAITSQIAADSNTATVYESHSHQGAGGLGPLYYGARSRGTQAAPTVVAADDPLFSIYGVGFDGTDYSTSSLIQFMVDGTPGANDMPGRIVFFTSPDGSQTLAERLRIINNGAWGLAGATYGTSGQVLTSAGSGGPPTWATVSAGVTQTTGTFNVNWSGACTTTPVQPWVYTKTGNVVSIRASAGFQCTSDIVGFISDADMPADIRPANATVVYGVLTRDNGTLSSLAGCLNLAASGTMQVSQSTTSVCNGGNFTAFGTKGMMEQGPQNFTYTLD